MYTLRLMAAAKEFNIGKDTLVDFLVSKGFSREDLRPTSKLTEEMFRQLQDEFQNDKALKVQAPKLPPAVPRFNEVEKAEENIKEAKENGFRFLSLANLGLTAIPRSLLELKDQIMELSLGSGYYMDDDFYVEIDSPPNPNSFSDISILSEFKQLKTLYLPSASRRDLENLAPLIGLERLVLRNSKIYNLKAIDNFPELQFLDLSGCPLTSLDGLERLPKLRVLKLSGAELSDLKAFTKIDGRALRRLELSYNKYADLPLADLTHLTGLETLYLTGMGIKDAAALSQLRSLERLNLAHNRIWDLNFLTRLTNLNFLHLDYNSIREVRPLRELGRLEFLSLCNNGISDLEPLTSLTGLTHLDLSFNQITDLTPIRDLIQRKDKPVGVFFNEDNPSRTDDSYFDIILFYNPITNPPIQYLEAGADAILSYWDQQDRLAANRQQVRVINDAKLIIVGNSNVGKSTLAHLLKEGSLPPIELPSTHGLEFSTWKTDWRINDVELTVNIIDFGGQEYYHDTHHLFFNDRALFLLLWEPGSNDNIRKLTPVGARDRQETIRHFKVEYWLNAIDIYSNGQAPVLLVQTYMDKYGRSFLNMERLQKQYDHLADAISISMNVAEGAGMDIGMLRWKIRALYEAMPGNLGQAYDGSWIAIRDHIEHNEKDDYSIMTIAGFRNYFLEHAGAQATIVHTEEDIRTMCITLNYWGVILYRYEMAELRDTVIINPQRFTRQINRLLTEKLRAKNGGIWRKEVPEVLEVAPDQANAFIKVLKVFKILFEMPRLDPDGEPFYISPMYLEEKPSYADLFLGQFVAHYRISYEGYFHKGILLECFDRLGQELLVEKGLYFCWQWGMVLKRGHRIVCIEFDDVHLNEVHIKTIRQDREQLGHDKFIQDIFGAFNEINKNYRVDLDLSCDGRQFVPRNTLLEKMAMGLNKFDHDGHPVDVRDFAFLLGPEATGAPFKRVFVSYSSKDRTSLDNLEAHLKLYKNAGSITYWNDLFMDARAPWDEQIKAEMQNANILIMLLSPDYLGTDYIVREEIPLALSYQQAPVQTKQVFWVQLKPCDYEAYPGIAKHPIYPLKEKEEFSDRARQLAISEHGNQDREWVKLLKRILES